MSIPVQTPTQVQEFQDTESRKSVRVVPVLVKSLGAVRKKPQQTFSSLDELCKHLAPVAELTVEARL